MTAHSNTALVQLFVDNFDHQLVTNIWERHMSDDQLSRVRQKYLEGGYVSIRVIKDCSEKLVEEIRKDGSHTFFNMVGRDPVDYAEVAKDVADKFGVDTSKLKDEAGDGSIYEAAALDVVVKKYIDTLPENERVEFYNKFEKKTDLVDLPYLEYGIGYAAMLFNILAPRGLAFAIPGVNVLVAAITLISLGGPAYRKTKYTVPEIAQLRLYSQLKK